MPRLWPPEHHVDEFGDDVEADESLTELPDSASLIRQAIHLDPQPGGWLITVDSTDETGKVQFFVPQDRNEPARILVDSRSESRPAPFEEVFRRGHYAEAAAMAEQELRNARGAHPAADQVDTGSTNGPDNSSNAAVLISALRRVALSCLKNGNYERADAALSEAISICESEQNHQPEIFARLLHDRAYARCLFRCTDEESTLDVRREMANSRTHVEQLLGVDHLEVARFMTSQARMSISEFSYLEADELLSTALQIRERELGGDHLDVAESLLELARLNAYREHREEADEGFRKVISIREALCGAEHPDVADALFQYTDFLVYDCHEAGLAKPLLRRALAIWKETIGLGNSQVQRESDFVRKVFSSAVASDQEFAE